MKLRNALRLLADNFSDTFKLLLYRFITGCIFFGLSYVILDIGLKAIITSAELKTVFSLVGEFFVALFTGNHDFLNGFETQFFQAFTDFLSLLGGNLSSIIISLVAVCALYLCSRFLNGIAMFAMGSVMHDKLRAYSRTHFSVAFFKNMGKAMLYQIIYVPLSFLYDLFAVLFCWAVCLYTPSQFPSWGLVSGFVGLSAAIAIFICFQAFKMTFVSPWIPTVVSGNTVCGGFKRCFSNVRTHFWEKFATYFLTLYFIVIVNVICAICTLGSFTPIAVSASYLFLLCIQFIFYFEERGKKYYLNSKTIVDEEEYQEKNELHF